MSEHQKTTQAIISRQAAPKEHQKIEKLALLLPDGRNLMDVIDDYESRLADLEA